MLPKTTSYVKRHDGQTKLMYFLIKHDVLLEKYNTIWDKVSTDTKIKSHGNEVTDFMIKKIPKIDSNHTCLAVISLDSALKKDDNYYLQVLLGV